MAKESKTLSTILLKENLLNGTNYIDWYRKLKIVLKAEITLYVLEEEPLKEPGRNASDEEIKAYEQYKSYILNVECLMLSTMTPKLQKQIVRLDARAIDLHLQELFAESARVERYDTSRSLFGCRI